MAGMIFFFQAEDGIRDYKVTGVQTCALPISVDHGEERVVGRAADVRPGMELRAALPDDDRARGDELPGKALHAEVLGPGVSAVAGGTDTLLVCHASVTQSLSLTSAIFTSVNGCRCPAWRRYPLRRANR